MPQSKKDLRNQKQKDNVKAGIGDAKGKIASNPKVSWNPRLVRFQLVRFLLYVVRIPRYVCLLTEDRIFSNV